MADLINLIKNGEESAFMEAYETRKERVYFFFLKRISSEEDALDLTQDAFMKLWQYRKNLSEEYVLDQYLFSIVRTVFIDYLEKKSLLKERKNLYFQSKRNEQYSQPTEETTLQFLVAQKKIPEIQKKVFLLHKLQGYSYKEIAGILSISVKSVDNHMVKAVKQLKGMFNY